MEYKYPKFIVDTDLKRLHFKIPLLPNGVSHDPGLEHQRKCDFGESEIYDLYPFEYAVRLYNEEAYRPCGNCLVEEGGEVSNWKERAERAETRIKELEAELNNMFPAPLEDHS